MSPQSYRLPAYFLTFVGLGLTTGIIGPALPTLAANTGSDIAQIGLLFLARAVGDIGGSYLGGKLYDRFSSRAIMPIGLGGLAVVLALIPHLSLLWLLLLASALMGLAGTLVNVGGNATTVWLYGPRSGGPLNGIHFSFALGAFLAPIIFAQSLLRGGGATAAFLLLALFATIPLLWLWRLPAVPIPPAPSAAETPPPNRAFVALACLIFFLFIGAELAFGGWLYTYALALGVATETSAAYLTSAFYGAVMVGRLAAVWLANRLRPRTILLSDLLLALVSAGLIWLRPFDSAALWLGVIGLGLGIASIFSAMLSLAQRRIRVTGQFTSWLFMSAALGATLFPWLMGQLFTAVGPSIVPGLVALNMLAALIITPFLVRQPGEMERKT
jgi:MFS transporter, FHS family, Na+ dependent glucose transporter 1